MSQTAGGTQAYYDQYWTEGIDPGPPSPQLRKVLDREVNQTSICLDVGCGDGRSGGVWLPNRCGKYIGVDVSAVAVEKCIHRGLDARVIQDATVLPFETDSIDFVLCTEVLEHLFAPDAAAREILRVLKPSGAFVATVPNVSYWRRRFELAIAGRWNPTGDSLSVEQPWRDPHIRFFNAGSLTRMLSAAGFKDVKVSGYDCGLLRHFPVIYKHMPQWQSIFSLWAERAWPAMFGHHLLSCAHKPAHVHG